LDSGIGSVGIPAGIGPAAGMAYAGFGRRLLAVILDGIILSIPAAGLAFAFGIGSMGGSVARIALVILYDALLLALWNGQTIGKMAMGIRVITAGGAPIPVGMAFARAAMKVVAIVPLGLGFLWMFWDADRQTWYDKVAKTYVVTA
jgi:uncharacterized RDD family membrane protein YckC